MLEIVLIPNFSLKWKFWVLAPNWSIEKVVFPIQKGKHGKSPSNSTYSNKFRFQISASTNNPNFLEKLAQSPVSLHLFAEYIWKIAHVKNHKRNINKIYNEKLHFNCLQQLPALRQMPTQEKKKMLKITVILLKIAKKAKLNFNFKSRFSVKPSKLQTYYVKGCRYQISNQIDSFEFWTKFSQKGYSKRKIENRKREHHH